MGWGSCQLPYTFDGLQGRSAAAAGLRGSLPRMNRAAGFWSITDNSKWRPNDRISASISGCSASRIGRVETIAEHRRTDGRKFDLLLPPGDRRYRESRQRVTRISVGEAPKRLPFVWQLSSLPCDAC